MQFLTYSRHLTYVSSLLLSTLVFSSKENESQVLAGCKGTMWPHRGSAASLSRRARLSEFEFWFCYLFAGWLWTSYFILLCLCFLVCKVALITPTLPKTHSFCKYSWSDSLCWALPYVLGKHQLTKQIKIAALWVVRIMFSNTQKIFKRASDTQ